MAAWWEGSPQAGLERAVEMGGMPPPGSLPPELMNEYRMSRDRSGTVEGWNEQAAALAKQQPTSAPPQAAGPQPARRRRRTAKDAGDALALWSGRENQRLMAQSGVT